MENPRPEKVAVVDEVRERLNTSDGAILTEYRGLSVKDLATLRRALRDAGGEYKIYKNTLVRFAVRDLGVGELEEMLTGPVAIAFVEGDAAAVAKALRDFARTNPHLVIKGGLLGGNLLTAGDASALAELPSREVLLARIAGGLAAPMQKFAGLLQALPRNFAYGLKALIDQQGGVPEAAAEPEPEPVAEAEAEAEAPAEAEAEAQVEEALVDEAVADESSSAAEEVVEPEVAVPAAPQAPEETEVLAAPQAPESEGAENGN